VRHAFAVVLFGYGLWRWREIPILGVVLLGGAIVALGFFIYAIQGWVARRPLSSTSADNVPYIPSLEICETGIAYDRLRNRPQSASWGEIIAVVLVREMYWDMMLLNFHWRFLKRDGTEMWIWEEDATYRERLMEACEKHLPQFSVAEAERCFNTRDNGRWTCFERLQTTR